MSEEAPALGRPDSPEPAALERQNLLAVRRERLGRAGQRRFPLHRLLVVARLGEGTAAEEVAGYHRELFENALEDHSREQVSGLLLLYSSYILHVVESCSSTVHLIIQDLASLQNQGHSALLQEIKVLVVAHNIPTRLFPDWYVAIATAPVTCPQDSMQSQSTAEVVAECLTLLLQLAACIQSFEDDSEDASESVHTLAPELLIPAETINYLCNAEECASPEDFLRIYLSPSEPALDSDTVWPVPSHFSA
ncbi:TEX47 protein, partial [Spizaetus tyrannus]|nr:TEX47 protein [Spizaetus tyrannus]